MALLFIDGFDHYSTADMNKKWTTVPATVYLSIDPTGGRRGTGCALCGAYSTNEQLIKVLSGSYSSVVVGFALYVGIVSSAANLLVLREGATNHLLLSFDSIGRFVVKRGTTTLGTSTEFVSPNTWVYVEFKATINDTTGSFEVRLNGVNVLSATGIDTRNGGTTGLIDNFFLSTHQNAKFDDFYICDTSGSSNNDFLGDCRIDTILPNSDGFYTNGTPSTGTAHYACVDENPPNTTDYISMDVVSQRDSYGYPDIAALSSSAIYGVQLNAYWMKDDAGSRSAATFVRSVSTNADGASVSLPSSFTFNTQIFPTDPDTSAAWTQSAINAAEFGTVVTA